MYYNMVMLKKEEKKSDNGIIMAQLPRLRLIAIYFPIFLT